MASLQQLQLECVSCFDPITQEQALKHNESFWCTKCVQLCTGIHPNDNNGIVCPNPKCMTVVFSHNKFCCVCGFRLKCLQN